MQTNGQLQKSQDCFFVCTTFDSFLSDLANGSAKAYGETMKERAEILNSTESIAIVPPLTSQPVLLYFDDITEDAQDWKNRGAARFYQKE